MKAITNNMISSGYAEKSFTSKGYNNWKKTTEKNKGFKRHESSASHKKAVARYISIPAEVVGDIGELISDQHAKDKVVNRKALLSILDSIRYLARQALPLRGNWNLATGTEENSNFYQLMKLRA